jgi:hypothetical protein
LEVSAMDSHTNANVKLLLSPRQSQVITYWIYIGRISPAQAKRVDEMQAVADAWSLMANIFMVWNTSQMQAVLDRWSNRRQVFPPELAMKSLKQALVARNTHLHLSASRSRATEMPKPSRSPSAARIATMAGDRQRIVQRNYGPQWPMRKPACVFR